MPTPQQSLSDRAPSLMLSMHATEPTEHTTMATTGDATSDQDTPAGDTWIRCV
jgi:hypothetical protein